MGLLAAANYDPATAVTKATSAALAMTAMDTTNLRVTFTVPASGKVAVHLGGVIHGANTFPQVMLGILNGSTVVARKACQMPIAGTSLATTFMVADAVIGIAGLTPGASLTWDAAYAVETVVASTGIKYGGPNNTTANDAFGMFQFEVWEA